MRRAVIAKVTGTETGAVSNDLIVGSWAIVHGLAFLAIDGHLSSEGADWKHVGHIVRRILRTGWQLPPSRV